MLTNVIKAELIGDYTCSAAGITAQCFDPVLGLCRKLVAAGFDPAIPLEAWRGKVLCLRVSSIGEGAQLEITGKGVSFRRISAVGTALSMRFSSRAAA
jgi:hypothetical protein